MPFKNVVSWNAIIVGYVHNHMFDQTLNMFSQMLIDGKFRLDQSTLVSILSACSHLGSLEHGKLIDSYIKRNNYDLFVTLGNALIDMFAKCGDIENAKAVFHKMPKRCIITWTTIVSGLAVHGKCIEALDLFDAMCLDEVKPDDVIFIVVLSACAHGELVGFFKLKKKSGNPTGTRSPIGESMFPSPNNLIGDGAGYGIPNRMWGRGSYT
ncbi:hypothetical protein UlMin_014206 [Ulmus minor]